MTRIPALALLAPVAVFVAAFVAVFVAWAPLPALAQQAQPPAESNQSAAPAKALTPAERRAIEDVVRDVITKHPELIIESIQALRDREQRQAREKAAGNLVGLRDELENDPGTPAGGNPKGNVTIVEFFDYRCGYCKRVFPDVLQVLDTDKNVRLVFREFPILGPESHFAATAALAAWLTAKDKYQPFHTALMQAKGGLPETRVMKIAAEAGLDPGKLRRAMADPRIATMIERNYALAQALEINGTPAFIIGDHVIRGAIDLAALKKLVAAARGS